MASEVRHTFYSGADPAQPRNAYTAATKIVADMTKRQADQEKAITSDLTVYEVRELVHAVEVAQKAYHSERDENAKLTSSLKESRFLNVVCMWIAGISLCANAYLGIQVFSLWPK